MQHCSSEQITAW